jgi:hypothetical protein
VNTFKQFAESTIKASPILTEGEIEQLLLDDNTEPLWRYAYRIAGFVAVYVRRKAPAGLDDDDWSDAVQECMAQFPIILERYTKTEAPFLKYMASRFQTIMQRYVWQLVKGGTGGSRSGAQGVESINPEVRAVGEEEVTTVLENVESTAFTTRDPLVELMAEEAIYHALRYAARHPKPGPREW